MSSRDNSSQVTTPDGEAFPRRAFIRGGALSVAGLVAAGEFGGFPRTSSIPSAYAAEPANAWRVPEAAYVRDWGVTGAGPCSAIGDQECATGVPTGLQNLAVA
ncbi:hypothetical protein ACFWA5_48655 [Streptomyces mirabilis]|uniref:hypothetical protein n=1 Tax=Streptomyces mirabilis TaxID=68239 RepID=UPI003646FEA7